MAKTITFKGSPLTLCGRKIREGMPAPGFKVVFADMKEIGPQEFKDKIKIITTFPSLDTPVCDLQIKEFNKRASSLSADIVILGVSHDLPFAQKRFCDSFEIKNVRLFSDYRWSSFGINYGLLLKELQLLARAVLIVDKSDIIRYVQIAPELSASLDYKSALDALSRVLASGDSQRAESLPGHCLPCEGGVPVLSPEKVQQLQAEYRGWELIEQKKIVKTFSFKDFVEATAFLDLIFVIAQEQGHHPAIRIAYNTVRVSLTTHAAGGLTKNDFIMAGIIDELL